MSRQLTKLGFVDPKKTLFMLCDIQDKFRPGMKYFDTMVHNVKTLVAGGKALDIPLVVSEHYPERLGNITKELDISHAKMVYPKTLFSMVTPELKSKIAELHGDSLETVVLFGLEAHICVEQSAMDLTALGYQVHVVEDCSMSRCLEDRKLALERMKQIGCFVTTGESVLFKLMRDKNHPKFKDVAQLVREPRQEIGAKL